ncbi:MAG: FAD-binding oxidoreductase [Tagaea sp.]|nr:FAD-binding oxidoreductase [Tagaea sp.]
MNGRIDAAVAGGGVVGLACAFALVETGRATILFDPAPGRGASWGNAGGITPGWVAPLATPATLRALPAMLTDALSPLAIRPSYLPRLLRWLLRFAWAARPARAEAVSRALAALTLSSIEDWADLCARTGTAGLMRRQGLLYAYASRASREAAENAHAFRRARGVGLEEFDADALRRFAPMLAERYAHAVYAPDAGHFVDPGALCDGLAAAFQAKGGRIERVRVDDVAPEASGLIVRTAAGDWRADRFVLCAGAFSKPLAARLGANPPLDVERGYHAMLPSPGLELPAQMIDGEGKYALTSMAGGLRLAGTVEFAGLDAPPDLRRAERLIANAKALLPGLNAERASFWMGFRPSLPDGLPAIGRAPAEPRAIFAFAHAHLGVTLAAITARIVAALVEGAPPGLDLGPYRADRFRFWGKGTT